MKLVFLKRGTPKTAGNGSEVSLVATPPVGLIRTITLNSITSVAAVAVFFLVGGGSVRFVPVSLAAGVIAAGSWFAYRCIRRPRSAARSSRAGYGAMMSRVPPARMKLHSGGFSSSPSGSLERVKRSAERVGEIEDELIRRISERYSTDQRTRALIIELQICRSRMHAQLADISAADENEVGSLEEFLRGAQERYSGLQADQM